VRGGPSLGESRFSAADPAGNDPEHDLPSPSSLSILPYYIIKKKPGHANAPGLPMNEMKSHIFIDFAIQPPADLHNGFRSERLFLQKFFRHAPSQLIDFIRKTAAVSDAGRARFFHFG
jgi:hypothetical protein